MTVEEWKRKNLPIQRKHITNADCIRSMSDEELVLWFMDIQGDVARYYCGNFIQAPELPTTKEAWIKWLTEESEDK